VDKDNVRKKKERAMGRLNDLCHHQHARAVHRTQHRILILNRPCLMIVLWLHFNNW
jgi:hypothetical protein